MDERSFRKLLLEIEKCKRAEEAEKLKKLKQKQMEDDAARASIP